jgi:hypothetical protein
MDIMVRCKVLVMSCYQLVKILKQGGVLVYRALLCDLFRLPNDMNLPPPHWAGDAQEGAIVIRAT